MVTKEKSVTEIIAGALELWTKGPRGGKLKKARWTTQDLKRTQDGVETYCALGALSMAANGVASYDSFGNLGKAKELVASFIPKKYGVESGDDIPDWNDSLSSNKGFPSIKSVFCKALKASMKGTRKKKSPQKGRRSRA